MGVDVAPDVYLRQDAPIWWPRYDHAPDKCLLTVKRGLRYADFSIKTCPSRRVAVQAGGHVGLWPLLLAEWFDRVYTFEPDPHCHECLLRNIAASRKTNVVTDQSALSYHTNGATLHLRASAGSARVGSPDGSWAAVPVATRTIDGLGLRDVDAIFLDVEGGEVDALRGAVRTIEACRPVIHLEMLPAFAERQEDCLRRMGYRKRRKLGRDACFVPA